MTFRSIITFVFSYRGLAPICFAIYIFPVISYSDINEEYDVLEKNSGKIISSHWEIIEDSVFVYAGDLDSTSEMELLLSVPDRLPEVAEHICDIGATSNFSFVEVPSKKMVITISKSQHIFWKMNLENLKNSLCNVD